MSEPESKKDRRLESFQVDDVIAEVVDVAMESCARCVLPSVSAGSGDGEDTGEERSSWLELSPISAGGFPIVGVIGETGIGEPVVGSSDGRRVLIDGSES